MQTNGSFISVAYYFSNVSFLKLSETLLTKHIALMTADFRPINLKLETSGSSALYHIKTNLDEFMGNYEVIILINEPMFQLGRPHWH